MSFISAFNTQRERCLFCFFIIDETSYVRDLIKHDSLTRRKQRSSKIVDLWIIVASLMFVWAHSKSFDAFEIDFDSHSICSLSCRIFCGLLTTCRRYACNIARVIVTDSSVNQWKRRVFRSRESKWMWRERSWKCFENIYLVWQRTCWWFSFFSSWVCVKSLFRKWESSEQRMCTEFEFCEK